MHLGMLHPGNVQQGIPTAITERKSDRPGTIRRSAVARLSACRFSMVWCRMGRRDGPDDSTTSTTATAMRDISSSLAPPRSASKVARRIAGVLQAATFFRPGSRGARLSRSIWGSGHHALGAASASR